MPRITAKEINSNRRAIEMKVMEELEMNVTALDFAEYFYAPPAVINRDMKELKLTLAKKSDLDIEKYVRERDSEIYKELQSGKDVEETLAKYGLWRMPKDMENPVHAGDILYLKEDNKKNVMKAMSLIELGFSETDAYKQVGNVEDLGRASIHKLASNGFKFGHEAVNDDEEVISYVRDILVSIYQESGENYTKTKKYFAEVNQLTGIGYDKMNEIIGKSYSNCKIKEMKNNSVKSKAKKYRLKVEIYNMWKSGAATQQEIADRYNVSRKTVINYINEVKLDYKNEIDPKTRKRQRNVSKKIS